MDKSNTLIVLGDSPFLGEIQDKLKYVLNLYPSVGINVVIIKYPTTYHIFQDFRIAYVANKYPQIKSITTRATAPLITKENKEIADSYSFSFEKDTSKDIIKDGKLAWFGFTHDYAISWAIWKGFKNAILIGAADFIKGPHHTLGGDFIFSEKLSEKSIKFISEICTERINVYTCNPDSALKVPRITIDDLLV